MTTQTVGEEGFRWFVGKVEDRNDPLKQGRVRIRIYNIHGNPVEVPTEDLPWATILMPGYSASLKQVGVSPTGIQVESTVIGFFLDGNETTMPLIIGVMPGQGDVSELARENMTINKQRVDPGGSTQSFREPESAYQSKYPYNKVFQSESGHVFEVDDTPNFERIHTYHRSGTYAEIDQNGRKVEKIIGDDFEIVMKNKTVYIKGNVNIKVDGTYTVESKGNMRFKAPRIDLN
jgi:hypothetical protein